MRPTPPPPRPRGSTSTSALALVPAGALAAFLLLPVVALFTSTDATALAAGFAHPLVWPALRLSLFTTTTSLLLVVAGGLPLAWWLARADGRAAGRLARGLETLLALPVVMPPAVAGVALLLAYGRRGLVGSLLPDGVAVGFTTTAVVAAEIFVSAPFFLQAAVAAFRSLDPELLDVASSLGARPAGVFFRVALPLSARALLAGATLSWARALGELGATLMFAGNLPGVTQTAPLAVYTALETDLRAAQAMALLLVAVALAVLVAARRLAAPRPGA